MSAARRRVDELGDDHNDPSCSYFSGVEAASTLIIGLCQEGRDNFKEERHQFVADFYSGELLNLLSGTQSASQ